MPSLHRVKRDCRSMCVCVRVSRTSFWIDKKRNPCAPRIILEQPSVLTAGRWSINLMLATTHGGPQNYLKIDAEWMGSYHVIRFKISSPPYGRYDRLMVASLMSHVDNTVFEPRRRYVKYSYWWDRADNHQSPVLLDLIHRIADTLSTMLWREQCRWTWALRCRHGVSSMGNFCVIEMRIQVS